MEILTTILPYLPIVLIVIVALIILKAGYVKAPPDTALIISGMHKKPRVLIGKAGIRIPFFERVDNLSLGAIQIDVKTGSAVPTAEYINVRVDSTVSVRVGQNPEMIALAAQNFLNVDRDTIARKINDLLEGNIREIVGQMKLTDMVSDRKLFSEKVQENAVPDLARYGLELITFNVQNFSDDNDVITNLGIDNVAQISKNAAIAKSNAEREIEVAKAENAKQANDAKVKAAEDIATRNNDLAIKQAQLQQEADTRKAQAAAATGIEEENQRKIKEVAATNANIAKAEREAELKQKQIQLKEYELDALVRKQAEADKFAAEKQAEADLVRRQKEAEAKAYEAVKSAEAKKAQADADRYAAEQQAAGIQAVGAAEAAAIEAKAEAQKKMGEASIIEMYFKALPDVVASAAAPLAKVDKIVQYGDGNSTKLVKDVMTSANQIMEAMADSGIDIKDMLTSALKKKD
jgi:flotillin